MSELFALGQVLITPAAAERLESLGLSPLDFLRRHHAGDWSELNQEDIESNREALTSGTRIFSGYDMTPNERLWIITEADRSATTLLLPGDY